MVFALCCKISIERKADGKKLSFTTLNSCEIEKSIYKINSSAKIRIPTSARLKQDGKLSTQSVQTGKQFERGDKITIELGYNDKLVKEFTGYIYRINFSTPLEIECEGSEFLLRTPLPTKKWKSTTLKEIVKYISDVPGITLSEKIPQVNINNYVISTSRSRLEALQEVKEAYGLAAYFVENNLYVGLAYTPDLGVVKYSIGVNTVKDDKLKYRYGDDVKLKIKAIGFNADNTKLHAEIGDHDGQLRTLFFYNVTSVEALKKLAQEEIQKYKYSGYEGQITAFLVPYAIPGMKAELSDPKYAEKKGTFYISSTKVEFGRKGARRYIDIDVKLQ